MVVTTTRYTFLRTAVLLALGGCGSNRLLVALAGIPDAFLGLRCHRIVRPPSTAYWLPVTNLSTKPKTKFISPLGHLRGPWGTLLSNT
jgi:hypothetical protein